MSSDDVPPHSRVFIMCPSGVTDTDIRNEFSRFGMIEDVWFVKKKRGEATSELCYVKFNKSSQALQAIEEMNGRSLTGFENQPIKVIMAANRSEGNVRRGKDGTEQLERLFLLVPKGGTEESIRADFEQFGKITDFLMVKSGRFAYISFSRAYEAALAIEGCVNKSEYKPRIADPPGTKQKRERDREDERSRGSRRRSYTPEPARKMTYHDQSYYNNGASSQIDVDSKPAYRYYDNQMDQRNVAYPMGVNTVAGANTIGAISMAHRLPEGVVDLSSCLINNPTRCTGIYVKVNYPLTRETLFKLCNLIPGIEYVEIHKEAANAQKTVGYIRYNSPAAAAWAWEKLQDFEYPPGYLFRVRYTDAGFPQEWLIEFGLSGGFQFSASNQTAYVKQEGGGGYGYTTSMSSITHGSSSYGREYDRGDRSSTSYDAVYNGPMPSGSSAKSLKTTVNIGTPQPKLPANTPYVDRCFVVVTNKIPVHVMEDIFSTFGDFIEFYYLGGKACGYANFGSTRAVEEAIQTLNGETLYGERIKVIRADPEPGRQTAQTV